MIQASNGNLYGTLGSVNDTDTKAQLFTIALDGSGFEAFPPIDSPQLLESLSTPLQAADGNLWLTASGPGEIQAIVSLSPKNGSLLQNIKYKAYLPLIQGTNGDLYGLAAYPQGDDFRGGIFSLNAQ